jgi:AcrR family transcriptional regulator
LPKAAQIELTPRKTPVQARSTASVDAIHQATIQVLLAVGKEKLTTTRVAQRAGVSVGTLYQYFPNKSALLQSVLRAHLDGVYTAVTTSCEAAAGKPLAQMADILVHGFLSAKLQHQDISRALYFIADDVGGAEIARNNAARGTRAIAAMLETAPHKLREDPHILAATVMAALAGISRRIIESSRGPGCEALQRELSVLVRAYLCASEA